MKKLILTFILINLISSAIGQELKLPVNVQSPNAASLGKYGDVPVSYFTGTPNISVPLHSLSVRGIGLNIGLSYDASGIRINSHPGWVGQNWSLFAGGVITRTVQGGPDELYNQYQNGSTPNLGYFYNCGQLIPANITSFEEMVNFANNRGFGLDYEPDIFTFNFMGISGKFFMGNDGEWKVSSSTNLKVIYDNNTISPLFEKFPNNTTEILGYPKVIGGFKLIDDNGTTYVFGFDPSSSTIDQTKQKKAIEYSMSFFNQYFEAWVSNAWHLVKVIDKYGIVVYNFEYAHSSFIADFYRNTRYVAAINSGGSTPSPGCQSEPNFTSEHFQYDGRLIMPSYLSKITTYHNDIIIFEKQTSNELKYDQNDIQKLYGSYIVAGAPLPLYYLQYQNNYTGPLTDELKNNFIDVLKWYKLSNIQISNGTTTIKNLIFNYTDVSSQRLKLESIDIFGRNQTNEPISYKFRYNDFASLPKYLSKMIDHWGYNNGSTYTAITKENFSNHYTEREPNANFLPVGMLNTIIYPTGGFTKLEYEPHTYSKIMPDEIAGTPINENGIAGGVRIKKITDFDGYNKKIKSFKYVTDYENNKNSSISSGILTRKPNYYWSEYQVHRDTWNNFYREKVFSINSIVPLSNYSGTHIGYSEVAEVREDGSYTLYKYTDYISHPDLDAIFRINPRTSPYDKSSDRSLMRGKLYSLKVFDSNNKLLKEKKNNYRDDETGYNGKYVIGCNARYSNVCPGTAESVYRGESYKIYYFDYDIKEEEEITYYDNNKVSTKSVYTNEDILPSLVSNKCNVRLTKQVATTTSDGEEIVAEFSYPLDLNIPELINDFRIGELVQTKTTKNSKDIGFIKNTYKLEDGNYVISEFKKSNTNEAALETEMIFDKYINGKLVQYHKPNKRNTTIIWGYNHAYPIAKIENASYSEIESLYTSLSIQSNNENDNCFDSENCKEKELRIVLNSLRSSLPNALITSYTYDPEIGLTSITDPAGKTEYYRYDNFGRLKAIYDTQEKIVKTIDYNLKKNPFFSFIINGTNNYKLGESILFNTAITGGSGNFSYDWKLKKGSLIVASSSSNNIGCFPTEFGSYEIECTLIDNASGISITETEPVYVSKVKCQFINIDPSNPNESTNKRTGTIYAPLADVVKIAFLAPTHDGTINVSIRDDNQHYFDNVLVPYQNYEIEVPITRQGSIYCEIENQGGEGSAWIEIKELINNTTELGYNKKLSIPLGY